MQTSVLERPRSISQRVFELVKEGQIGDLFTNEQIENATGKTLARSRQAVKRASQWLRKSPRGVGLVNVRGVGYQIGHPDGTPELVQKEVRGASKKVTNAKFYLATTNFSEMSAAKRAEAEAQMEQVAVLTMRMEQAERVLNFHSTALAAHDARLERMERELEEARGVYSKQE